MMPASRSDLSLLHGGTRKSHSLSPGSGVDQRLQAATVAGDSTIVEPLASDLAIALDPVALARRAGIEPDPWQAQVLRSSSPRLLLNCCRQSGKSSTVATLAVHTAVYTPPALVLLLSPSQRQSGELFKKCLEVFGVVEQSVPTESETVLRLELANGSRIVSLPGRDDAAIRGFSGVKLLIVDEASRVPDALYSAVRPMLAVSGGRLAALSTPWGRRGWWYREWTEGGPGWERVKITAHECPRITDAFLEEERRSLGEWWFNQEYLCSFEDNVAQVFPTDLVMGAFGDQVEPLFADDTAPPAGDGLAPDVEPLFAEVSA